MDITKRLGVEGPDTHGGYQLTWEVDEGEWVDCHYISRAEADALIAALQPPQPVAPDVTDNTGRIVAPPQSAPATRPSGPHESNADARKPVK